jgi:hypothetical protein
MAEERHFVQERTRLARENLATLLFIVIILGFAIGLVTNLLSTYIIDKESFWPWLKWVSANGVHKVNLHGKTSDIAEVWPFWQNYRVSSSSLSTSSPNSTNRGIMR